MTITRNGKNIDIIGGTWQERNAYLDGLNVGLEMNRQFVDTLEPTENGYHCHISRYGETWSA
jgi:hypothetical protein